MSTPQEDRDARAFIYRFLTNHIFLEFVEAWLVRHQPCTSAAGQLILTKPCPSRPFSGSGPGKQKVYARWCVWKSAWIWAREKNAGACENPCGFCMDFFARFGCALFCLFFARVFAFFLSLPSGEKIREVFAQVFARVFAQVFARVFAQVFAQVSAHVSALILAQVFRAAVCDGVSAYFRTDVRAYVLIGGVHVLASRLLRPSSHYKLRRALHDLYGLPKLFEYWLFLFSF